MTSHFRDREPFCNDSKILYFLGEILEKGRYYAANFNLAGENGVGEFFFCKRDNLDDRYSFDNVAGDHTARFAAEDREATMTDQGRKNADVTHDGNVDSQDAAKILQYIAKKITLEDLAK